MHEAVPRVCHAHVHAAAGPAERGGLEVLFAVVFHTMRATIGTGGAMLRFAWAGVVEDRLPGDLEDWGVTRPKPRSFLEMKGVVCTCPCTSRGV
jgi:hypothetical protein